MSLALSANVKQILPFLLAPKGAQGGQMEALLDSLTQRAKLQQIADRQEAISKQVTEIQVFLADFKEQWNAFGNVDATGPVDLTAAINSAKYTDDGTTEGNSFLKADTTSPTSVIK